MRMALSDLGKLSLPMKTSIQNSKSDVVSKDPLTCLFCSGSDARLVIRCDKEAESFLNKMKTSLKLIHSQKVINFYL